MYRENIAQLLYITSFRLTFNIVNFTRAINKHSRQLHVGPLTRVYSVMYRCQTASSSWPRLQRWTSGVSVDPPGGVSGRR